MISILVGLISSKAWAVLVGASGLGYMGLLQSLVGLAGLLAGMGIGTGLVRIGANALAQGNQKHTAALIRAIWLLFWAFGGLAVLILVLFRIPISRVMLGGSEHAGEAVSMSCALLFTLAAGIQANILNTFHRVNALAKHGILNSVIGAGVSLALVWRFGERGIAPAIILSAVASLVIASLIKRAEKIRLEVKPTRPEVLQAVKELLFFGGPYTASMLVGTGVQFLLPALVLHILGEESVGYYRAAVAISVTYLGFLLIAMGMDYYPRVSAVSDQPDRVNDLVNQQFRLVLLLITPMILAMLAFAPYIVQLVYSPQFKPSANILEWQLFGDLFKFASWILGTVILARSRSTTIFLVELIAGINILLFSTLGVEYFGLAGLGVGFLMTYLVHWVVVWIVVRRSTRLIISSGNKILFIMAIISSLIMVGLSAEVFAKLRLLVSLVYLAIVGAVCLYLLYREVGKSKLPAPAFLINPKFWR